MTRKEILEAAEKCVCGDREQDYGSPEKSFMAIGKLWEIYFLEKFQQRRGTKILLFPGFQAAHGEAGEPEEVAIRWR